ncbi:restriction endonuclease subunit S [uncultured Pelagibacterium sp.]|uniref:restriction endonuclease subunit S n=1 Tax=uncultured Pelagibacterium sp. TaxID=1159875 RepID=UPI0030D8B75F
MNAERLLALYEKVAEAPDAFVRLRRFVLDLAVRGKLVAQDAGDEPASELLKRIAAEKALLVKAGEIKQPKTYELPNSFDTVIPDGWAIVPLGNIINNHMGGGTPSKNNHSYWDGDIRWASVKDVGKSKYIDDTLDRITRDGLANSSSNLIPPGNLIVVTRMGLGQLSISRVAVAINQDLRALFLSSHLETDFVYNFFLTNSLEGTGLTVKGIKLDELMTIPFPLPPLSEQRRIVARVEELMALLDRLEAARTAREATRDRLTAASLARLTAPEMAPEDFPAYARFALATLPALTTRPDQIKPLRQTILNLAVRGELVEQDPTDEPVTGSLEAISAKRDAMVRSKELRREKPLSPAQEDDAPFQIPSTWQWVRVGDLALFTQYGTSAKAAPSETGIPVLTMGNIQDGAVFRTNEKRIPETSDELPSLYLKNLDLLYNRTNSAELVGKTGLYRGVDDSLTFASYLIRIRLSVDDTSPIYVNLAMNAPDFRETQIVPHIKQQTGQANVSGSALKNMLIPLPPLSEQHRIVAKVDALMALCDRLEAALTSVDTTRARLLEALLHEALAPTAEAVTEAAE